MANILHTIYNTSTTLSAVVNSFTFETDTHIQHHADLSTFGSSSDYTGATTIATVSATYEKGGLYRKNYSTATFAIVQTIKGFNGTTLVVQSTAGLVGKTGWEGNGAYSGIFIVSITSATWLLMSGPPVGTPTIDGIIKFSTSTNELTLSGTTPTLGMGAGWTILGNGYNSAGTVISVKDSTTLIVNNLPDSTPTIGSLMTFRAPGVNAANTLTVTSSAGLSNGFIASGNGFTLNQYITNISGNILTMSAEPNVSTSALPAYNASISFSNINATLYTIPASSSVTFNLNYTNNPSASIGNTYASTLTVKITQGTQQTLTVRNYVGIDAAPIPPPPPTYTGGGGGRGGGGPGGDGGIGTGGGGYAPSSTSGTGGYGFGMGTSVGSGGYGQGPSGASAGGGGDPGGAGGVCIVPWALVTMADGSFKQMQFVKEGDLIQGITNTNVVIENLATQATSRIVSFNNIGYFATETHPFMTNKGWGCFNPDLLKLSNSEYYQQLKDDNDNKDLVAINETNSVYTFINGKKEQLSVENILYQSGENFVVYKIKVSGDRTFIVENIVSHNKE